jgi:hypothetical protein
MSDSIPGSGRNASPRWTPMQRWAVALYVLAIGAFLLWREAEYARREESAAVQQAKEREEAARRLEMAEQAVAPALAEAAKARHELHPVLHEPGGVFALLDDPERWRKRLEPVQAALARARAAIADLPAVVREDKESSATLQRALDEAAREDLDRRLALRLERIRVARFTIKDAGFDLAAAAREYPMAFAEAGVAIHDPATSVPAAQIATSPIRELLLAALDDWAAVALHFRQYALLEQLLAVARCADADPAWRDKLRKPEVWHDARALTEITNKAPENLTPRLYGLLTSLAESGADGERLLRDGLGRYPGDFWLNFQMASVLPPGKLVEAVGFARAAVAARPHEAAAYNNLACLLSRQRFLTEARTVYERALEIEPQNLVLQDNLNGMRYYAACGAARAAAGDGPLAATLLETERAGLRRQALAWLRAELDGYAKAVRSGKNAGRAEERLAHWLEDEDLFGVRDPRELPWLPEDERRLWRELWAEVQQVLEDARGGEIK